MPRDCRHEATATASPSTLIASLVPTPAHIRASTVGDPATYVERVQRERKESLPQNHTRAASAGEAMSFHCWVRMGRLTRYRSHLDDRLCKLVALERLSHQGRCSPAMLEIVTSAQIPGADATPCRFIVHWKRAPWLHFRDTRTMGVTNSLLSREAKDDRSMAQKQHHVPRSLLRAFARDVGTNPSNRYRLWTFDKRNRTVHDLHSKKPCTNNTFARSQGVIRLRHG